jgi:hypothetical protein
MIYFVGLACIMWCFLVYICSFAFIYDCNHGLLCCFFFLSGVRKLAWMCSVSSISFIYCKVSLAAHVQFKQFHGSVLGSIHIGGSGPTITAHDSLDLKQEIQIQIQIPTRWDDVVAMTATLCSSHDFLLWKERIEAATRITLVKTTAIWKSILAPGTTCPMKCAPACVGRVSTSTLGCG